MKQIRKNTPLVIESFGCRPKIEKYQVRFWTSKIAYRKFKAECEKRDIKMQDAFNQFIHWFYSDQNIGDKS